jgi:hypothetical protein
MGETEREKCEIKRKGIDERKMENKKGVNMQEEKKARKMHKE